jgi:hypothetical protein
MLDICVAGQEEIRAAQKEIRKAQEKMEHKLGADVDDIHQLLLKSRAPTAAGTVRRCCARLRPRLVGLLSSLSWRKPACSAHSQSSLNACTASVHCTVLHIPI